LTVNNYIIMTHPVVSSVNSFNSNKKGRNYVKYL
jgi:hypothetical protein